MLDERLFDSVETVVLTSATLAVAGSFEFVQQRLGMRTPANPHRGEPLRLSAAGAALRPASICRTRATTAFTAAAREEIVDSWNSATDAPLCSSPATRKCAWSTTGVACIHFPTFLQGTAPATPFSKSSARTPNCVLFATSSFWQGVDVPGDQLSCVIIDKLPFAVPSDPVVEARIRRIRERGGDPFYDYQMPQAAIALKQGFGRLIRSRSDRGVLALLDNRITKQRTAKSSSTASRTTDSRWSATTWRSFSMFEVSVEQTFAAAHALRDYKASARTSTATTIRCR